jgi:hypothetical protein
MPRTDLELEIASRRLRRLTTSMDVAPSQLVDGWIPPPQQRDEHGELVQKRVPVRWLHPPPRSNSRNNLSQ